MMWKSNRTTKAFIIFVFYLISHATVFAGQLRVSRVIDGDSIKVKINGMEVPIRLAGIDAPELGK